MELVFGDRFLFIVGPSAKKLVASQDRWFLSLITVVSQDRFNCSPIQQNALPQNMS